MKKYLFSFLIGNLGILIPLGASVAEDQVDQKAKVDPETKQETAAKEGETTPSTSASPLIPYIPPAPEQATPQARIAIGGTRGEQTVLPTITLLVPEHVAYTLKAQPSLYWHLDKATESPVVLTLTRVAREAAKPLLEFSLPKPASSGLHALHLSAHEIRLETGKTYEWLVSIQQNPGSPASDDLVARGFIRRTAPSTELELRKITAAAPLSQAQAYAKAGIWYDALAVLSEEGADRPTQQEQRLHQAQAQLLEQVGLTSILNSR